MTPDQRRMARHALGLPNHRQRSYRNHYSAGIGTPQAKAWDELVQQGLAERGTPRQSLVGYCLTHAGALVALQPSEALDPEDFPEARR